MRKVLTDKEEFLWRRLKELNGSMDKNLFYMAMSIVLQGSTDHPFERRPTIFEGGGVVLLDELEDTPYKKDLCSTLRSLEEKGYIIRSGEDNTLISANPVLEPLSSYQ